METRGANTLLSTLLYANQAKENNFSNLSDGNKRKNNNLSPRDSVNISGKNSPIASNRTQIISDITEKLENGYRRTQEFERADGQKFTRIEEFLVSEDRARRNIVQQNASGSTSLLEDIFDRREDGSFRLTQRYTNEIGETSVNINTDAQPPSPDIVLGRIPNSPAEASSSALPRGSELDIIT